MIIGELSALGGSCCWATCSTLFTASVRRLGVYALNLVRLWFARLDFRGRLRGRPFDKTQDMTQRGAASLIVGNRLL